jgi:hypothetical protein
MLPRATFNASQGWSLSFLSERHLLVSGAQSIRHLSFIPSVPNSWGI